MSQFGAGPFGTQMLADLGADVIKIEDPGVGGDSARYVPPFQGEADSPYFQSFNRGKRSVTLNLRHPDGQAVFHDLVRVSDAVFNNARGDLPDKLGLTYGTLKEINPRRGLLLAHRVRATGPRAAEPAFDYLVQGYAGYMAVTGEPDGPPGKCGVSVIDFAGGYAAMVGLMVGLFDAQRTGHRPGHRHLAPRHRGEHAVLLRDLDAQPRLDRRAHPRARRTRPSCPPRTSPPATAGSSIFCNKDKFWRDLVETLGVPELAEDARFRTFADRFAHKDALVPLLKARFADAHHRGVARASARPRAVRAGQRRAPGAGRRAGAGARYDRGGGAPGLRAPARGAQPRPHRGRDPPPGAGAEARRAHRRRSSARS